MGVLKSRKGKDWRSVSIRWDKQQKKWRATVYYGRDEDGKRLTSSMCGQTRSAAKKKVEAFLKIEPRFQARSRCPECKKPYLAMVDGAVPQANGLYLVFCKPCKRKFYERLC